MSYSNCSKAHLIKVHCYSITTALRGAPLHLCRLPKRASDYQLGKLLATATQNVRPEPFALLSTYFSWEVSLACCFVYSTRSLHCQHYRHSIAAKVIHKRDYHKSTQYLLIKVECARSIQRRIRATWLLVWLVASAHHTARTSRRCRCWQARLAHVAANAAIRCA